MHLQWNHCFSFYTHQRLRVALWSHVWHDCASIDVRIYPNTSWLHCWRPRADMSHRLNRCTGTACPNHCVQTEGWAGMGWPWRELLTMAHFTSPWPFSWFFIFFQHLNFCRSLACSSKMAVGIAMSASCPFSRPGNGSSLLQSKRTRLDIIGRFACHVTAIKSMSIGRFVTASEPAWWGYSNVIFMST